MKTYGHRLPFGLKDGLMVDISEVERGLACGCICPVCRSPLQANQGGEVSHYFSHDPIQRKGECHSALETVIHLMAKQILEKGASISLPQLEISEMLTHKSGRVFRDKIIVAPEKRLNYSYVDVEKSIENIRPDVILYASDSPYIIEIAVTHFVDNKKKDWFREQQIFAIEIDLSKLKRLPSKLDLYNEIIIQTDNKKWLSNPDAEGVRTTLRQELQQQFSEYQALIQDNEPEISEKELEEKRKQEKERALKIRRFIDPITRRWKPPPRDQDYI